MFILKNLLIDILLPLTKNLLGEDEIIPIEGTLWQNLNINNWEDENSNWQDFGN